MRRRVMRRCLLGLLIVSYVLAAAAEMQPSQTPSPILPPGQHSLHTSGREDSPLFAVELYDGVDSVLDNITSSIEDAYAKNMIIAWEILGLDSDALDYAKSQALGTRTEILKILLGFYDGMDSTSLPATTQRMMNEIDTLGYGSQCDASEGLSFLGRDAEMRKITCVITNPDNESSYYHFCFIRCVDECTWYLASITESILYSPHWDYE